MNPVLFIIPLLLVISVPTAFAQVVETKGQNYDLREDYFIGEAMWQSHPERIMDNGWKNYALSNTGEKVIFNTNSIGSLIYDKNSCSYSIYENGYNGAQVIPSVSAVASYLDNGVWSNLPVNDEACTVTVDRYEDGVFLTSTKVITQDTTQDIFIPISAELFYSNSTLSEFTLINGANSTGYFNGETITTTGIVIDKFVQELRLDINSGFKETFKVWHDGTEELGISQTVHTGESITIGDTTINIAQVNGQSFDKQFIEDNEAEILQLTDSINYDFSTGIKSLTNVNIIFDGDYKVNLDYANGLDGVPFVGYLEIDPTFTQTSSSDGNVSSSQGTGSTTCPAFATGSSTITLEKYDTTHPTACVGSWFNFDVSSIPSNIVITDATIEYDVTYILGNQENCDWKHLDFTAGADATTYNAVILDSGSVTDILQNDSTCSGGVANGYIDTFDTGSYATLFQSDINGDGEISLGLTHANWVLPSPTTVAITVMRDNDAELTLTYSFPVAPDAPTNLSTVTGIPIELDWDATPTSGNGGTAITGYKVFRSDSVSTQVELPNNSGSDSELTFTDNEFLLHGFETTSPITFQDDLTSYTTQSSADSAWVRSDTSTNDIRVNIANDNIDFDFTDDSNNSVIVYDLGSVSDDSWILTFKAHLDSKSSNPHFLAGLSDEAETSGDNNSQKFLGMVWGNSGMNTIYTDTVDGANPSSDLFGGNSQALTWGVGEDKWIEIIRTSPTNLEINVYSDSTYSTLLGTVSETISGTTGLQYIKFMNHISSGSTNAVGTIDDVKFYNGVTSTDDVTTLPDKSTNSVPITYQASGVFQVTAPMAWDTSTLNGYSVSTVTNTDDKITKTAGNGWNNSGAGTSHSVGTAGSEFSVEFGRDALGGGTMIGLDTSFQSASSLTIPFGIYMAGGYFQVYENGGNVYNPSGSPQASDRFKIEVEDDGTVNYYHDVGGTGSWVLKYTSSGTAVGEYIVRASSYGTGAPVVLGTFTSWQTLTDNDSTTGTIGTAIQDPNLTYTDAYLPDNTDTLSVGGWVKLDEDKDSTKDATKNNGVTTGVTGKIGNAWQFGGTTGGAESVSIPISSEFSGLTGATISGWVNWDSTARAFMCVFGIGDSNSERMEFCIEKAQSVYLYAGNGANGYSWFTINDLPANTWHYVTLVYDGTLSNNARIQVYIDGTLHTNTGGTGGTHGTVLGTFDPASEASLGNRSYDLTDYWYKGLLDDMVYYNKALTSTEVLALYNSGSGTTTPDTNGLVAHYNFEQTGSILENQIPVPPANTKLLGLNDVTFSVGTTTASVDNIVSTTGNAWEFGSGDYIQFPSMTVSTEFSASAWVKTTDGDFMILQDTSNNGIWLGHEMTYGNGWRVGHSQGGSDFNTSTASNDGTWHHVVWNVGTPNEIFIDGVSIGDGGSAPSSGSWSPVMGGTGMYDLNTGIVDDVGIWDRFLTNTEITSLYTGTSPSSITSGLVASYNFEQTSGDLLDQTSNNHDGTNNGATQTASGITTSSTNTIISATGLTDNTSTPQHYAVTRDSSNLWTIYQNGVSEATATDSTSLGANFIAGQSATYGSTPDYEVTDTSGGEVLQSGVRHISAMAVKSGSVLIGEQIAKVEFPMYKTGSPSGTVTAGVFDSSGNIVHTFGTMNPSDISTSTSPFTWYSFEGTSSHTLASGDYVGIHYNGGDSSNRVIVRHDDANPPLDGTNTVWSRGYTTGSWQDWTAIDQSIKLYVGQPYAPSQSSDYTTNLSGNLDEFFINSDTLTSTEIANINVRGETPTLLTTTTAGTTNYDDSTVVGGNNYYFSVQSVNSIGSSPYITPFVNGLAGTPADPPSSVASTISNPNTAPLDITVSWSAPTNVGSGTLTGFEIYRDGTLLTTTGLITSYTDTVPTGGGTFEYKLKSLSTHGVSGFSSTTSTTTPTVPPTPTATPTLAITNPNPSPLNIDVSWLAQSSGGSTITGYEIFRSADDITFTSVGTVTDLDFTDTVPSAGTWYYTFASTNLVGASGQSPSSNIATPTIPSSDSTTTLNIINPNPSPLDITVSLVSPSSNGGSAITGYNIFSSPDDITYTQVSTNVNTAQTITVANAGTWYFKSQAINNVGTATSQGSAVSIATPTVPPAPASSSSSINSIDTAPYVVNLSWTLPSSTGGSDLTGYNVYRQTGSGALSLITTTTALSYIDTVPTALNQAYTYNIHAVNNVGESTLFTTTTITTGDVPSAPVLTYGTAGTTSFSWTIPSSDATITGYKILRDSSLLTTVTAISHSDFTTINFGQSYTYNIKAVSSLGDGISSNSIVVTPETEITGMIAQGVTGTGAVIDWDEPAYYQGQITSYNVYYITPAQSANPTTSAGTTSNTYSNFAPTLSYGTSYTFGVSINSPLGNSGFSNLVNVTTSIDGSIVTYDPTTGGMEWFDIDSVNDQTVNVIEFTRESQPINGTATDTLQVGYPSWWDDMTCDVDYKFAQKTEQYVEGTDMTAVVNSANADQQVIGFSFQNVDNEVIEVECAPQQSTQDDGVSGKYVLTQNNIATGLPNIPLVTQITNFSTGSYGTDGDFGALDIVGIFVIMISMVGFNRVSPIVGVLISASLIFIMSFFGIITIPTVIVGVIGLVIFLAWGIQRNR